MKYIIVLKVLIFLLRKQSIKIDSKLSPKIIIKVVKRELKKLSKLNFVEFDDSLYLFPSSNFKRY